MAGQGFKPHPSDPRSDAFHFDSLQPRLSKKLLIHDRRAGNFDYLSLRSLWQSFLTAWAWFEESGMQGARAEKAFLPQGRHMMGTLFSREKMKFHHVFTHVPSAGDCFCLPLNSGHTCSCDFPEATFSHLEWPWCLQIPLAAFRHPPNHSPRHHSKSAWAFTSSEFQKKKTF